MEAVEGGDAPTTWWPLDPVLRFEGLRATTMEARSNAWQPRLALALGADVRPTPVSSVVPPRGEVLGLLTRLWRAVVTDDEGHHSPGLRFCR